MVNITKKKVIKSIIFVSVMGLLLAGLLLFYMWTKSPSVSQDETPQAEVVGVQSQKEIQKIETRFFITQVPIEYKVEIQDSSVRPSLVQASAYNYRLPVSQIGFVTDLLPPEGITGVANYNYRVSAETGYEKQEYDDPDTIVFKKKDNTEITAFKLHTNGRYVSISLSSQGSHQDKMNQLFKDIDQSWRWLE